MTVRAMPIIETERLRMRLANIEDVPAVLQFFRDNEAHLQPWEPTRPDGFYSKEYWRAAVTKFHGEFLDERSLRLILFKKSDPARVAGTVNFSNIVRRAAQYCNLGYSLAERDQGQGYMLEAVSASLDYVFTDMNIHRVMANYMPRNARSGKLLRRLGFTVEGYARAYLRINGRWEDHILTSLTNPRWRSD